MDFIVNLLLCYLPARWRRRWGQEESPPLAALDQALVLGGLALAAFVCARWLHLLGRKLPQ